MKWCTYGAFARPTFIGKLTKQEGNTGRIQYAEKQMYSQEYWDMTYVKVFESLEEAIIYTLKNSDETLNNIKDSLHFKEKTDINWDNLRQRQINGKL